MSETPKVYVTSILNDVRRKLDTPEFEGGAITSILGSVDLDLRETRMKIPQARLEITNILGSVYVYPSEDWEVSLEITEIAGKVKDYRKPTSDQKSTRKRLQVSGITLLGDVYIR